MKDLRPKPWYRHPWPWILMSGPAIVVVAGIVTAVLAVTTADGLVAEDYYRRGIEINRKLTPAERANLPAKRAMPASP